MIAPARGRVDSTFSASALGLAAVGLGRALQINDGMLHPQAMLWLSGAFALCLIGVVASGFSAGTPARWGEPLVRGILLAGLLLQLLQLASAPPAFFSRGAELPSEFRAAIAAVATLAVLGAGRVPGLQHLWFPAVLIIHAAIGVWILRSSPQPGIDVFVFQRDASAALLHGGNPYTVQYPDIYGPDRGFYGGGLSVNGRLTFGFPYFPLSLLLVLPGHLFAGDFRYAHLLALTGAGALMGYARTGSMAAAAACLYLFTPRLFFVLEQGWTEPLVVLLLAFTVFCACRSSRMVPYAFGLFLAVKQYLVFAVPVAYVLAPAARVDVRTILVRALLVSAVVTLPFFLWGPRAFIESVVTLQLYQPFRPDSLSFPAWIATHGGPVLPGAIAFAAAMAAHALALWGTARTPAGTAAALALVYFAFFSWSKQAFANYYLFVVGALCCAISAVRFNPDDRSPISERESLSAPCLRHLSAPPPAAERP